MVSIRKAKQGFHLRKRGRGFNLNQYDKEKVGLLIIGVTVGFLGFVALMGVFSPSNSEAAEVGILKQKLQKLRRKKHIQLEDPIVHKPMKEEMNALAQDVFDTLGCQELLNKTSSNPYFNRRMNGGETYSKDEPEDFAADRRRLEEAMQQHGDDGGFENMMDKVPNAANKDNKADEDSEDWGKDAEKAQAEITDDKFSGKAAKAQYGMGMDMLGDDDAKAANRDSMGMGDDFGYSPGYDGEYEELSARHLFCLAASPNPPENLTKRFQCDATKTKRKMLLDLWSAARAQISNSEILKQILDLTHERTEYLLGKTYYLWAPTADDGITYVLNSLNSENDADNGGILGLSESLGPGKLFVDIGSCLGLTALAITSKYPGTQIASIEPASPNWLMQEINLRCNLEHDEFKNIKVVMAGVGPNDSDEDNMMSKIMWRSTSTTSARSWTPEDELGKETVGDAKEIDLIVRLRKLKSVLAEADVYGPHTINVMNIDCAGCEYNLIPALSDEEFDAIPTVLGGVHWGYIPTSKLPSSSRGKLTHKRLCRHENVAKRTKECCAFPDMAVQSSVPGEVLVKDSDNKGGLEKPSTVMDVIMPGLCDDFDDWAKKIHLFSVQDDWGWFELTNRAAVLPND